MRLAPGLAVPVLAALLAGCLGFGHCGMAYTDVRWHDPGLYAALGAAEPAGAEWSEARGRLPWNGTAGQNGTLPEGTRLDYVRFELRRPEPEERGLFRDVFGAHIQEARIERDGWLVLQAVGNASAAGLRAAFDAIVRNATEGLDAEAAWRQLLASQQEVGRIAFPTDERMTTFQEEVVWAYRADLRGHLRLDGLAADLALGAPDWGPQGGRASSDGWTFFFSVPEWRVQSGSGVLTVDAADQAEYEGSFAEEAQILEAAGEAVRSLGLGREAALDDAETSGVVC